MTSKVERYKFLDKDHPTLSIRRQCGILSLTRSSIYAEKGENTVDEFNEELMKLMDKKYLVNPEYGAGRMHTWLTLDIGYKVNAKRIERLYYTVMGLKSMLPGPHTSVARKENKKYPYLLKKLDIIHPNQVWALDITFIPMQRGHLYLIAIIDLYSRKILNWSISNTMSSMWCCEVLELALEKYGRPEIINTDQGSQFTSDEFAYRVVNNGIKFSMDGKGRALDNIFIERFWRTIKYEHIYLYPASNGEELHKGVEIYIQYYNSERRHSSIGNQKPDQAYEQSKPEKMAA